MNKLKMLKNDTWRKTHFRPLSGDSQDLSNILTKDDNEIDVTKDKSDGVGSNISNSAARTRVIALVKEAAEYGLFWRRY